LEKAIAGLDYDLVLTGVQSDDRNSGMVGIMLAERLGLAHAAVTNGFAPEDGTAKVRVELEGGMDEVSRIQLPALLTIQTGHQRTQVCLHHGDSKGQEEGTKGDVPWRLGFFSR
jgi:electron transfer flavoprotein beta subunit